MTRREAVRQAAALAFGSLLARPEGVKAFPRRASLTVDLDQWVGVTFKLKGRTVTVPVEEIFDALRQQRDT